MIAKRAVLAATIAAIAACGRSEVATAQAQNTRAKTQVERQLGNVPAVIDTGLAANLSSTFRAAAAKALPAVVQIRVQTQPRVAQGGRGFPGLPPGFFGFPSPDESAPRQGTGSGFIFDPQGYILTNNHVVEDATDVVVHMVDGREFTAQVVGRDPNTDVAVIKIEPRGGPLPVATFGNSDQLQVGDWVLALGNPLGLDFTVTAGIVSAKGRSIGILAENGQNQAALESFIQTDAAINPGNSGGPMVDLLGRVVGINSAIESPTGYFAGAGFAIPINLARRVASDLMKYGVVHRPRIGVTITPVTAADAEVYGLPSVSGALITSVAPDMPAARAGLQVGDVVTAVDDQPIETSVQLQTALAQRKPGDVVTLTIYRNRSPRKVQVKLGEFETAARPTTGQPAKPAAEQRLGFQVAPLTPQIAQQLGLEVTSGVVITNVPPLSPAYQRVGRGQVIKEINGQPIRNMADVERAIAKIKPGDIVSLRLIDPQLGETVANYRTRQ
ncbi:MAG: Do family serine endopeptidase [Gemmatimonadetes bacterium]|nr:Do family serine endopeptidase [Gemmatimonadota bacterium]